MVIFLQWLDTLYNTYHEYNQKYHHFSSSKSTLLLSLEIDIQSGNTVKRKA